MSLQLLKDRWRLFADVTALALGINLWASLTLLPTLFIGALGRPEVLFATLVPVGVLAVGMWKRSEGLLLFIFPSSLLAPIAMAPQAAATQVYSALRFFIVAISLIAFLFCASALTAFREAPAPRSIRPLRSSMEPTSPRWRRRFRIYAYLSLLSLVMPLVLLIEINFDTEGAALLAESYPGRAASFTTLLNIIAVALWLLLFFRFFLAPLKAHRSGDRALQAHLAQLRRRARRRSPSAAFYIYGSLALTLMLLWFMWQS